VRPTALALSLAAVLLASGCTLPTLGGTADRTAPGARAGEYLHAQPYTSILVELDYVTGAEPEGGAISLFQQRLQEATGKSVEVVRTPGLEGSGANHRYTGQELQSLEDRFRSQHSEGARAALYLMYLDGGFERDTDDQKVLGAAYHGSSLAMFKGNLRAYAKNGNPLDPSQLQKPTIGDLEGSVIVHEAGHVLGLVDIGTPMVTQHADAQHPGHSNNQESVMYWEVEQVSLLGSVLGQHPPNDFDANDRADLQAARR
jgi:hypothetical protein